MNFLTIDFETYYDTQYSLTKMSTEDYINDPRFEVILVSVKKNDDPPEWFSGTFAETYAYLHSLDIPNSAVLSHNTHFDASILKIRFGLVPKLIFDSLMMAQAALKPFMRSVSLDYILRHLDLGIRKGTQAIKNVGRTLASLTTRELEDYAEYSCNDAEGSYRIFRYLAPQFPRDEFEIMDMTVRMYLDPVLELDANLLAEHLAEVRAKKTQLLNSLPANVGKSALMSNDKFAELLVQCGVPNEEVPRKISKATGELSWAFAKTDTGWKEMEDAYADDPVVSVVMTARLGFKSTLEETRSVRLLDSAKKYRRFRVPLRYYAAHTGRYGGMDDINVQNFPRVDKSRLRFAIRAPKGYVVLGADLSQIEARITAWLAKQHDLLDSFRANLDTYAQFASLAYQTEVVKGRSKLDDQRRFVGKTCVLGLGYGMGSERLRATLRKDGIKMPPHESQRLVSVYRDRYSHIQALWELCSWAIRAISAGEQTQIGPMLTMKESIILPNGMALVYADLRNVTTEKYSGWLYNFAGETRTLWGGKVVENSVQALARILVMQYMLEIKRQLKLWAAAQQHDELDYVLRAEEAPYYAAEIEKIMTVPPSWAPDLPVAVNIAYGPTFGDCK